MTINEIFPNPTVKKVIFQIRFPNLFYIENKIGELQMKIMEVFPKSSLIFRKQLLFADIGPKAKIEDIDLEKTKGAKIWKFESEKDFELNILTDSLDITSKHHKTYNLEGGDKFREIIEYVLEKFFEIIPIPVVKRIGLRYIDECPIPSKDNSTFKSYYNSVFPLERFDLTNADAMNFRTVFKIREYFLIYAESLQKKENEYKLILDFDGFANDISPENCLPVLDELHEIINEEYTKTIKEPVYNFMRQPKESGE